MSTPVVDLAIGAVMADDPGPFGPVATHPSTVVALRELHTELRLAGPAARDRLGAESARGRQVLRVSDAVVERLEAAWYDEADLYAVATEAVRRAAPDGLRNLVLHLPQELSGLALDFVRALGEVIDVRLVLQITGDESADGDSRTIVEALGLESHGPRRDGDRAADVDHLHHRRRRRSPHRRREPSSTPLAPARRSSESPCCGPPSVPTPASSSTT